MNILHFMSELCLLPAGVIVPVSRESSLSENFLSWIAKDVTVSLPVLILSSHSLTPLLEIKINSNHNSNLWTLQGIRVGMTEEWYTNQLQ